MIVIRGTVDSTGILLLNNYLLGRVGDKDCTKLVITIDKAISNKFTKYYISATLPEGSSYRSERILLTSDNTIEFVVPESLVMYSGLVQLFIESYNDQDTRWVSKRITTRVEMSKEGIISSDLSGVVLVNSVEDIINPASINTLYMVASENAVYRWDKESSKLVCVGRDYFNIGILYGGNASE